MHTGIVRSNTGYGIIYGTLLRSYLLMRICGTCSGTEEGIKATGRTCIVYGILPLVSSSIY
jgi:hypothetical protein